jgi:hypothetical protein
MDSIISQIFTFPVLKNIAISMYDGLELQTIHQMVQDGWWREGWFCGYLCFENLSSFQFSIFMHYSARLGLHVHNCAKVRACALWCQEVSSSNFSQHSGYPDLFCGFSKYIQANVRVVP